MQMRTSTVKTNIPVIVFRPLVSLRTKNFAV